MSAPTFSGQTRDFAKFKRDFEAVVVPDRHPLHVAEYLRQAVPKKYHHLLNDVAHPEDMMEVLANKFGNRRLVVNDALSQIEEMGHITTDEEFVHFVEDIERIIVDFKILGYMEELANAFFISKLESKLSPKIKWEWSGIVVEHESDTYKERFDRLLAFFAFNKKKIEYLTADVRRHEGIEWITDVAAPVTDKEDMDIAASKLRKFRGMIYRKIKRRKPVKEVQGNINTYRLKVDKFLVQFGSLLTEDEHQIWADKKSRTSQDVSDYCEHISNGYDSDVSSKCVEQVETSSEESPSENELLNSTRGIEATFGKPHEVPDGDHVTAVKSNDEDIEARLLQLSLPDVPEEEELINPIDEEIEARLLRLKFFRKTWCREANQRADKKVEVSTVDKSPEIAKHSSDTTSFSTSQSSCSPVPKSPSSPVQNTAQSPPSCNCIKNTFNQTRVTKQQNTNVVPDKIPDLTNMQGMVSCVGADHS